jgi:hypothetical protein
MRDALARGMQSPSDAPKAQNSRVEGVTHYPLFLSRAPTGTDKVIATACLVCGLAKRLRMGGCPASPLLASLLRMVRGPAERPLSRLLGMSHMTLTVVLSLLRGVSHIPSSTPLPPTLAAAVIGIAADYLGIMPAQAEALANAHDFARCARWRQVEPQNRCG